MSDTVFSCSECSTEIAIQEVFREVVEQNVAAEIIEQETELQMDCPDCEQTIHFNAAEVMVTFATDDLVFTMFSKISDATTERSWNPDLEQTIQRERESQKRKEEIKKGVQELREELDLDNESG